MRRALLITALALFVAAPATGQPAPASGIPRLQAEFRDEQARARRLRAEAAEATAEIADLERELGRLRTTVAADDLQIGAQRARLNQLGAREAALTADLSRVRGRQARLLSALQLMSRRPPPPLLIPADRATDTVRAAILLQAMAPELQARARKLADQQTEIARVRRLAALSSEQLFTVESAQGDRRAEIESLSARKSALQTVLRTEAQQAERAAGVLEARIRSLGGTVPTIDVEATTETARLPAGRSRLTSPIAGAPSERFADRTGGWRWRADQASVVAPAAGRVAYAGPLKGWGLVIILDLGPGWRAIIAGLEEISVEAGARVSDGQTLGRSAADGEVYFGLRRDERPIDPAPWLG
ncbi:peptidoglycan DD-metalloendopeptidase family protein [uncultured Brevundimonas sp.]|uniref:murein hydrolase activator EnvC family protein n=1 Tax=uncultured Brevundimonas sp. TaxID=213418 RepID=UPI0030EE36D1|tara:strand:+ start:9497 stop:10570 length:1074 start_codon:yes stop_codon:yes gene_type:complete